MIKQIHVFEIRCNDCGCEFNDGEVYDSFADAVDSVTSDDWEVEDDTDNCWCHDCAIKRKSK